MLRIRLVEESLVEPISNGEIKCPVHLYSGEEAIATGVCANLNTKDYIFGGHRSHGHYLAKGGNLKAMIAEIYGKETGCAKGRGGSMHLIDVKKGMLGATPIVAGTISLALGAALGIKIKNEKRAVVSFFGDGATGEGALYESLNFAALKKLPIIFVCENNFYSTHLPIKEIRPVKKDIHEIAESFGIYHKKIDGNNVLKVLEASKKAVELCKRGKGPVFLEFTTYRLRGHVGPNDNIQGEHKDIRPKKEIEEWKKKDPTVNFEKYLISKKILGEKELKQIKSGVKKEIEAAYEFARKSPYPDPRELTKYVFKK